MSIPGDFQDGLRAVSGFERLACGRLVVRQLTVRQRAPRELERYGLEGAVQLAVARCFLAYGFIFAVVGTAFAVVGLSPGSIAAYLALLLFVGWACFRAATAARAGKRWRGAQDQTKRSATI